MKYNVGDRVRVKSLEWYNENKDEDGDISCGDYNFVSHMTKFCGKVITIKEVYNNFYTSTDPKTDFYWTDEMIEGLVAHSDCKKCGLTFMSTRCLFVNNCPHTKPKNIVKEIAENEVGLVDNLSSRRINEFNLPEGYIFKDENGNVINATKIVLEKKKKEYPKTYYECRLMNSDDNKIPLKIIEEFTKLINARNAYWRIAGREMGLNGPWKPDWVNLEQDKHCIWVDVGDIILNEGYRCQHILTFPTEEMRDAFYENFKEEIEICKELL